MKKKSTSRKLINRAEKLVIQLLDEAMGVKVAKSELADGMQFSDRRAALDTVTRFLAIKHRIDPEQEESEFMSMREELNGARGTHKNRIGEPDRDESGTGDADSSDSEDII